MYPFVPLFISFVPQPYRKYSVFQFLTLHAIIVSRPFFKISECDQRGSIENRLYPYVPLFILFVPQPDRKWRILQDLIIRYYCISATFQDIGMRPTGFDRESFVPVCTYLHFVSTSTGPEVANFARFDNTLLLYRGHFSRYRNATNGVQ